MNGFGSVKDNNGYISRVSASNINNIQTLVQGGTHGVTLHAPKGMAIHGDTLWVCDIAGGPQQYAATEPGSTPLGLEEAHRELKISPAEFDEVAAELGRSLDHFEVPEREKEEVLAAFAAHKGEVTEGYSG